ncbi:MULTISPECIES: hypothetical protein [unclassified Sphingobium]|nr:MULTISPECIES: hypothetical protein [unclassified Sphingobium]MCW2395323.1 hypothetical protein [Sphingobium sp. B8D3B]MCW2418838.1 hypothetical protein [Sphingobium sp. B8D3C]
MSARSHDETRPIPDKYRTIPLRPSLIRLAERERITSVPAGFFTQAES